MGEQDDKQFLARMMDLADQADRGGYITFSDFLEESQRSLLSTMGGRLSVCLSFFGGYPEAERTVAVFYPEYLQETWEEIAREEVVLLRIRPLDHRFLKRPLEHRDFLGSLLGCGIKREMLGDLLVSDSTGYAFVKGPMAAYLEKELSQVAFSGVTVAKASLSDLPPKERGEELVISVSSMRLDALVARCFNLARGDAAKAIQQGYVSINGIEILEVSKPVKVQDRLSVRHKGRVIVREEKGISRSGRQQVLIERFLSKRRSGT